MGIGLSEPSTLAEVMSVQGHRIRMTIRQWLHISENHDYMTGNRALVLESIADPDELLISSLPSIISGLGDFLLDKLPGWRGCLVLISSMC